MTRLAQRHRAINLSQGYPDFDPPDDLVAAAHQSLRDGHHQYSLTWGSANLRAAVSAKQSRFMKLSINPDEHITITCGSTEAMMASLMAVCSPGDKVIVFSPFYESYVADIALCGGEPCFVNLHPPQFQFDPDELRAAFAAGAKALILCNPSNPTGRVFTEQELQTVAELAQEYDAFVITDEVYEHIVYAPHRHRYIASLPGMFERTISCGSLSKTYSITGWRLGYAIASASITLGVRKVHDFLTVGAPNPLQEAAVHALKYPDSYYTQLADDYTRRRDLFLGYIKELGLPYHEPEGSYFALVDISSCGFANDFMFCEWLVKEIGIAAVPGSVFFHQPTSNFVRFHFSKRYATLVAAGERLRGIHQLV
ncbi:MAG TPA: aminotransferase class I/II-fold pyridoxal phosphate-dependent enzyme [Pyrinomonadaceae bacterium]|jgi:aminotransferase|nr:aminotransferase class I/II-fold pyridoxal phosphate-dependent enzyme [Pyrinomonadaceae bacterium]